MKSKQLIFPYSLLIITVSLLSAVCLPMGGLAPKVYARETALAGKEVRICVGEEKAVKVKNQKKKTHIKWKSRNPETASVTRDGVITGKRKGNTVIDLRYQEGKGKQAKNVRVSYRVKVGNYIKSMKISPQGDTSLMVGESMQIQTEVYPLKAKNKAVAYESENNGVATVTARGVVTAIKEGQVQIKVRSKAKTADKKYIQKKILVRVEKAGDDSSSTSGQSGQETPGAEEPGASQDSPQAGWGTSGGSADGSMGNSGTAGNTDSGNTGGSGNTGSTGNTGDTGGAGNADTGSGAAGSGNTVQEGSLSEETLAAIEALPQVGTDTLVAGTILAAYRNGETYTLYFINTAYEGSMSLTVGGYSYSVDGTSPATALRRLETMGYVAENSSHTMRIERKCIEDGTQLEEWWKLTDLESGTVYEIKGMRKDTVYANKHGYGLVVVKGDTRDVIRIQ